MITSITWSSIIKLLTEAKERIIILMPSIHDEWIDVLFSNPSFDKLKLLICIDNNEDIIRNGYGSAKSIEKLVAVNKEIRECSSLRINFLSADDKSYFLFIESRIISGEPDGYNAIKATKDQTHAVLNNFFPEAELEDYSSSDYSISKPFNNLHFDLIKESLHINPPGEPDLKRKINIYSNYFQYADLHFEGGNIANKTIKIPPAAIPFKDSAIRYRMRTSFKLFDEGNISKWDEFIEIRKEVDKIRKKYLTPCSIRPGKSILKKEKKIAFQNELEKLQIKTERSFKIIKNKIETELNNTELVLKEQLIDFFYNNPPINLDNLSEENKRIRLEKEAQRIIYSMKIPSSDALLSKIKIQDHYYDLTWEDLHDDEFMRWFEEKKLIDERSNVKLARFNNAYEQRR